MRRVALFYIFANFFNDVLIGVGWGLISVSTFGLLWYVVLVTENEDNPASYRYIVEKSMRILIIFLGDYGYPSLILKKY